MRRLWSSHHDNWSTDVSYFPKFLTFDAASARLPDMFHTSRGFFVFSERVVMENWAPGQLEFIPVACHANPNVAATLNFDKAYYFINVLGRTQRCNGAKCQRGNFRHKAKGQSYGGCCRTLISGFCVTAPPVNR